MINGQNSKSKTKQFTKDVHLEMKIMLKWSYSALKLIKIKYKQQTYVLHFFM